MLRGLAWTGGGQAYPGGLPAEPPVPHSSVLGWNPGASFYVLLNFPWVGKLTHSSSYGSSYTGNEGIFLHLHSKYGGWVSPPAEGPWTRPWALEMRLKFGFFVKHGR